LGYTHKQWINNVALEAENAFTLLSPG